MRFLRLLPLLLLGACGGSGNDAVDMHTGGDLKQVCPADLDKADGTACTSEGQSCGGEACTNACQFCNIIVCQEGKWTHLEVFPAACDGGV